ncbi:MAG: hypothetical protein V3U72_03745 [Candidatus Aenigmarchaeota archaeon]
MSKRRKKEADFEVNEKPEEKENTEKEKAPKTRTVKPGEVSTKKIMAYSVVVAVIFFGAGLLASPVMTGYSVAAPDTLETSDQFIFISPPGCTNCEEMEPVAREVANTLGIPLVKTGFGQEIPNPGFVLIYNDKFLAGPTGFDGEGTLKQGICQLTQNDEICAEASEFAPPQLPAPPTPDIPKSDKPEAHAFVMSYCPYGLQFLKAYVPVIELLGDKADVEVNFVHYLMHGEKEMTENTRMYCIQKEEKVKFTDYLRCFVEFDDPEKCMSETGIDSSAIDTCMETTDTEFELTKTFQESGERYPPYMVDASLAQQYGVGGSPTFGINGQQVSPASRSPEAIKQVICAAFNSPPEECSQTLSSAPEAAGLGPMGSGGGSGSQAQC